MLKNRINEIKALKIEIIGELEDMTEENVWNKAQTE